MSTDFYAGCYFIRRQEREALFATLQQYCKNQGFEYEEPSLLSKDSFWFKGHEGSMLVSICNKPEQFGFPTNSKISLLHFTFDYCFITSRDSVRNQKFLESVIAIQTELYLAVNAELGWAGYNPTMPIGDEYRANSIKSLHWFNILGPRFVATLGRERLLRAPGWQIKELVDGSVLVRLSEHPHVYEKVGGVYLHEYLELEYMG